MINKNNGSGAASLISDGAANDWVGRTKGRGRAEAKTRKPRRNWNVYDCRLTWAHGLTIVNRISASSHDGGAISPYVRRTLHTALLR